MNLKLENRKLPEKPYKEKKSIHTDTPVYYI